MASGSDVTTSQEPSDTLVDCPGKKKSKFQTFKNFFVRKKRKGPEAPPGEAVLKASQSTDDVNCSKPAAVGCDVANDTGPKVNMGSKAMSHDSVFVSDSPASEDIEGLESPHDDVHGKLLLKQAVWQATPPALITVKKGDDAGASSEDDGLPCSPPEISTLHAVLAGPLHKPSDPVQRTSSLSLEGSDTDDDQMSFEASSTPFSSSRYHLVDLSCPATPSSCLDSSAARHRIAVKNQACVKRKPASRELLNSSKQRTLSGKVSHRGMENELGDVTPDPSPAEEKCEDIVVQQVDSAERTSEELKTMVEVGPSAMVQPEEEPAGLDQWSRNEAEEHSPVEEASSCQDVPSPPPSTSSSVNNSEECLLIPSPDSQKLLGTISVLSGSHESLGSLDPTGDGKDFVMELGAKDVVEESGSLLQEVLSSLETPLTSAFVLEPNVTAEEMEAEVESIENVVTGHADELLLSSPVSQCDLVAPGSTKIIYVAAEHVVEVSDEFDEVEECSESEECAHLLEDDDENGKAAMNLIIVEPTLSTQGEEDREEGKEDKNMNADVASETEDQKCLVEVERLEVEPELESHILAIGGWDSGTDDQSSSEEVLQMSNQGVENHIQPSKESLSIADRDEPEDLVPSNEEPSQDLGNLFARANISSQQSEEEVSAKEDSGKHLISQSDSNKVRFTITPAWQRSLSGDGFKEAYFPSQPSAKKISEASVEARAEQGLPPKADTAQGPSWNPSSASSLPVSDQEVGMAETPFGVKLRKTSLRNFCYGVENSGETPVTPNAVESTETPKTCPALPRKSELLESDVSKFRKTAELDGGQSPGASLDSPSWVYVAKQKQKIFRENSLEESPRKGPFEKEPACRKTLSVLPESTTKYQAGISSPDITSLQPSVPCSLEISNPASVDKDGTRASMSPSSRAMGQEEPPWLALAKKKAKAWSEMPQIVQ